MSRLHSIKASRAAMLGLVAAALLAVSIPPAAARTFFSVGIGVPLGPPAYVPPPVVYAPPPVVYGPPPVAYYPPPPPQSVVVYPGGYAYGAPRYYYRPYRRHHHDDDDE